MSGERKLVISRSPLSAWKQTVFVTFKISRRRLSYPERAISFRNTRHPTTLPERINSDIAISGSPMNIEFIEGETLPNVESNDLYVINS